LTVDYLMITAQGYQESELKRSKRSRSGAVGIMQIKPSVWQWVWRRMVASAPLSEQVAAANWEVEIGETG
jgi:soluble lytic murein transglycosylase-like protein